MNYNAFSTTEAYPEPCQTSKTGSFSKIVNCFQSITIFTKHSILHVGKGYEYTFYEGKETMEIFNQKRIVS